MRAGIAGVLVDLPHQLGEHVAPGATLAKVVQPDQLKAALKIAETQARDIQIGQPASIDTHNGAIAGRVMRSTGRAEWHGHGGCGTGRPTAGGRVPT